MVLKYWVNIQWGLSNCLMTREGSLALVGNLSSDGVPIKILFGGNLKAHLITCYDA